MKALITLQKNETFDTFFPKEVMEYVNTLGEIIWHEGSEVMTTEEIKEKIADCDVYVTGWNSPALTKEILQYAPKLSLLVHVAGTVVPYVTDEMWDRGIRVICGNDFFAESVAEGTIGYMLASLRHIPKYSTLVKEKGIWSGGNSPSEGLIYKKVGIIGYGAIAKHLVKKLLPFNVDLRVSDITPIPEEDKQKYNFTQCSMEEIFSECDIVSVHIPYNDKTHHLIDDKYLSLLKEGSLLVNTSRGGVIDQAAMTEHLIAGHFNAMLDVLEKEPVDMDDPIRTLDNVLIMPHKGGPTVNLRRVISKALLAEARDFIDNGTPLLEKDEVTRERASVMSRR